MTADEMTKGNIPMKKKAGVVIDTYKLKVFEDALKRAKFKWKRHPGITKDTLLLKVEYDRTTFDKLQKVIKAANEVAALN